MFPNMNMFLHRASLGWWPSKQATGRSRAPLKAAAEAALQAAEAARAAVVAAQPLATKEAAKAAAVVPTPAAAAPPQGDGSDAAAEAKEEQPQAVAAAISSHCNGAQQMDVDEGTAKAAPAVVVADESKAAEPASPRAPSAELEEAAGVPAEPQPSFSLLQVLPAAVDVEPAMPMDMEQSPPPTQPQPQPQPQQPAVAEPEGAPQPQEPASGAAPMSDQPQGEGEKRQAAGEEVSLPGSAVGDVAPVTSPPVAPLSPSHHQEQQPQAEEKQQLEQEQPVAVAMLPPQEQQEQQQIPEQEQQPAGSGMELDQPAEQVPASEDPSTLAGGESPQPVLVTGQEATASEVLSAAATEAKEEDQATAAPTSQEIEAPQMVEAQDEMTSVAAAEMDESKQEEAALEPVSAPAESKQEAAVEAASAPVGEVTTPAESQPFLLVAQAIPATTTEPTVELSSSNLEQLELAVPMETEQPPPHQPAVEVAEAATEPPVIPQQEIVVAAALVSSPQALCVLKSEEEKKKAEDDPLPAVQAEEHSPCSQAAATQMADVKDSNETAAVALATPKVSAEEPLPAARELEEGREEKSGQVNADDSDAGAKAEKEGAVEEETTSGAPISDSAASCSEESKATEAAANGIEGVVHAAEPSSPVPQEQEQPQQSAVAASVSQDTEMQADTEVVAPAAAEESKHENAVMEPVSAAPAQAVEAAAATPATESQPPHFAAPVIPAVVAAEPVVEPAAGQVEQQPQPAAPMATEEQLQPQDAEIEEEEVPATPPQGIVLVVGAALTNLPPQVIQSLPKLEEKKQVKKEEQKQSPRPVTRSASRAANMLSPPLKTPLCKLPKTQVKQEPAKEGTKADLASSSAGPEPSVAKGEEKSQGHQGSKRKREEKLESEAAAAATEETSDRVSMPPPSKRIYAPADAPGSASSSQASNVSGSGSGSGSHTPSGLPQSHPQVPMAMQQHSKSHLQPSSLQPQIAQQEGQFRFRTAEELERAGAFDQLRDPVTGEMPPAVRQALATYDPTVDYFPTIQLNKGTNDIGELAQLHQAMLQELDQTARELEAAAARDAERIRAEAINKTLAPLNRFKDIINGRLECMTIAHSTIRAMDQKLELQQQHLQTIATQPTDTVPQTATVSKKKEKQNARPKRHTRK